MFASSGSLQLDASHKEGIAKLIAYLGLIKGPFPKENEPIR